MSEQERMSYLVVLKQLVAGRRTVHVQVSQRHHPQFLRQLSPGNIFHAQHLDQLGQSVLVQPRARPLCDNDTNLFQG